jgi:hypothetical protein
LNAPEKAPGMMEQLARGRKARSRYFRHGEMEQGFGLMLLDAPDLPRTDRDRLAAAVVSAYEAGAIPSDVAMAAYQVACALQAPCATLKALRWFTGADGREMADRVRQVAAIVPAVTALNNWIAL